LNISKKFPSRGSSLPNMKTPGTRQSQFHDAFMKNRRSLTGAAAQTRRTGFFRPLIGR
jgi:hypothetical protein